MNKYRYILYIICALCTLSCADDKMPIGGTFLDRPYHLSIGKDALSFGASQNLSDNIAITSSEVSWEITGVPDWLTLSATNGTGDAVVTVTASENKIFDNPRAALLNITSTSPKYQYNKSIAVSQLAATATISVDKTSLSLAHLAVTESVSVNSNVEWEAVCSSSWITLSKNGDTALQISASENLTGTARTATVNLHRKGFTATLATISVTQSEDGVTGSTVEVAFGIDGGTKSVEIDADVAWNASSSESWLAVTPEKGDAGKAQLKITALANSSANSRNGFVYVKIGSVKKLSIPVSQEGISLEVNGASLNFAANGSDSQKLSVTANKKWKVISSPEWITVTPAEGGKGTTEVAVKAAENRSLNPRSATFRIGFEGLNVYKDITVAQEGLDSKFGGSTLEFPWEESQKDEIVVPDSWNAMVSSDWISLSQYSGSGGETVYVMVQTNDNEDARTGTVTFVTEGRTFTFSVVQQGQYLKINSTAGEVAAMGGSVDLSITTTVGAKDSIEYEGAASGWLAVSGDSKGNYTLTAVYNPSMNPRVAQFVIKPTMDATNNACTQGVRFTVTQKGRNLMASTDKVEMFKSGGTSATYTITADGKYSISKPDADNWYVLQHDEEARSFTLYLSENSTDDTRESQLTISLLELPEGEVKQVVIPVTQYAVVVDIGVDVDGWDDDLEWDALFTGTLNGHDWVDLALPSGLKWAKCNVGASSPYGYGNYYAWGETSTKSNYIDDKSTTSGKEMSDIGGNDTYDVARKQWGSSWRLPTRAEFKELLDEENCTWEWTTQSGVNGYRVTSKINGASIFLPAAGSRAGTSLIRAGSDGCYLSSTPDESDTDYACILQFSSEYHDTYRHFRYFGFSVRPVSE